MGWLETNAQKLSQLHPVFADRVRNLIAQLLSENVPVLVTQGLRTWEEQDALYAQGRTAPGEIVTKAAGGHSQHNFGLAVDLCPDDLSKDGLQLDWNVNHPAWQRILELAPQFKLAEGAKWRTFPDSPHLYPLEIPATCEVLRAKYDAGGMKAVWDWFSSLAELTEVRH